MRIEGQYYCQEETIMSMSQLQKQTNANIQAKANLIWEIATHLVGLFKPHEYGKVILPMTVLKRFDDAETHQDSRCGDGKETRRTACRRCCP